MGENKKTKIYRMRRGWGWDEILEGVFFTPVISMIRSSDPFIFTSSELPNTDVCHRTISSKRKYKYCNVRECTATGTCCSRCATKTIKTEESNNTVCRDSTQMQLLYRRSIKQNWLTESIEQNTMQKKFCS